MKHFIIAVMLLPVFSFAQDCRLKKSTDDFTHETKLSTGFMPFGGGLQGVLLAIDADSKEVQFLFSLSGGKEGKCFDDASTGVVLFEGSKLKTNVRNISAMNCEGLFTFSYRNVPTTPSALQNFATKRVASIRINGSNKTTTNIVPAPEEQDLLMQRAACLIKESKTLLK